MNGFINLLRLAKVFLSRLTLLANNSIVFSKAVLQIFRNNENYLIKNYYILSIEIAHQRCFLKLLTYPYREVK